MCRVVILAEGGDPRVESSSSPKARIHGRRIGRAPGPADVDQRYSNATFPITVGRAFGRAARINPRPTTRHQRLCLQRDGGESIDGPWIPAFGEDDEDLDPRLRRG
mgnify:CR=1 FL=1